MPPPSSTSALQLHSQGVNTSEMGMDIASSSQRAHLCTTCLKGFRSKQQLAQHSLVHTNIRKYTCSYCERAFKQLSHLQQHTRIHTGKAYDYTAAACTDGREGRARPRRWLEGLVDVAGFRSG